MQACIDYSVILTVNPPYRSIIKTVRIEQELLEVLEKDAKAKRMNFNAYLTTILKKHAEWGRLSDPRFVTMMNSTFQYLLEQIDDDKITKAAEVIGERFARHNLLFFFKEANLQSFIALLELYTRNSGLYECDYEVKGKTHVISLRHDHGMKWSKFLRHAVDRALQSLDGISAKFEVEDGIVIAKFSV